ncbi:MAG: rhomboid family protein [Bacteriovoracaceae bacterium]|nr:rhomboid family protein [Bacteriovoracaceae bacterium]
MNQVQFQAPKLTKINKIILIATVVGFLATAILKAIGAFSLVNVLGLSGNGLFQGLIFQLITYPFIEVQLMGALFNCLIVWFIGSELESQWGQKIYLRFLLLIVIGVGLIFGLVNLIFFFGTPVYFASLHGLSGINFALLIAYSLLFPDRQMAFMMIFPMRAKTFCWILVGIEVYMAIFTSLKTSWAHLLAMGLSFLIIHFQNKPLIRTVLQSSWKPRTTKKKHLYVVKDDDQKPPKYWQ